MKIFITRHGKTENNQPDYPFHSRQDSSLNEVGRKQAEKLSNYLMYYSFDVIYTSPMKRAVETARIVGKECTIIKKDKRLSEVDFGIFDGKSLSYVKEKYNSTYQQRKNNKFYFRIPDGETYQEVYKRLDTFLEEIKAEGNNALVVTHATSLKLLLMLICGISLEEADSEYYNCTTLFGFDLDNNWAPIIWNSTYHLKNV